MFNNPSFNKVIDFYENIIFVLVAIFGLLVVAKIYSVISDKLYDIEHPLPQKEGEPEKEKDLPTKLLIKIKNFFSRNDVQALFLGLVLIEYGRGIKTRGYGALYYINKSSGNFESNAMIIFGAIFVIYSIYLFVYKKTPNK